MVLPLLTKLEQLVAQHCVMVQTSAVGIKEQVCQNCFRVYTTLQPAIPRPQLSSQWKATSQYASTQRSGFSSLSSAIEQEQVRQDTVVRELQESLKQASEKQEQLKMVSLVCYYDII